MKAKDFPRGKETNFVGVVLWVLDEEAGQVVSEVEVGCTVAACKSWCSSVKGDVRVFFVHVGNGSLDVEVFQWASG